MFKRLRLSKKDIYSDLGKTQDILKQIRPGNYSFKDINRKPIQDLLDIIDQYQLDKQGSWFGVGTSEDSKYIIAFLLGAKDFIENNKCMYNMRSDNGMTYYQLLKNMVSNYNRSTGDNSINPDPYTDLNDEKLVEKLCSNPQPSPPSPPSPYNQPLRNQTDLSNKAMSKKSDYNCIFKVTIATLLFIILSNQKVYEFTNKLFPTLLPSSCPSEIGNILHAVVFFLLFYVLLYLIK